MAFWCRFHLSDLYLREGEFSEASLPFSPSRCPSFMLVLWNRIVELWCDDKSLSLVSVRRTVHFLPGLYRSNAISAFVPSICMRRLRACQLFVRAYHLFCASIRKRCPCKRPSLTSNTRRRLYQPLTFFSWRSWAKLNICTSSPSMWLGVRSQMAGVRWFNAGSLWFKAWLRYYCLNFDGRCPDCDGQRLDCVDSMPDWDFIEQIVFLNSRVAMLDGRIAMVQGLTEILLAKLRWLNAGLGCFKAW